MSKVAGCEWEFTFLKEFDDNGYVPIEGDTGSLYEPLGVVNGRCSFNSLSEECHGPLCEHMTLTMQGGVYVTMAYSYEPFREIASPPGDACEGTLPESRRGGLGRSGNMADMKQSCKPSRRSAGVGNTTRAKQAGGGKSSGTGQMWSDMRCSVLNSPLAERACARFGKEWCTDAPSTAPAAAGAPAAAARAQSSRSDANGEQLYAGMAVVYAGQTSVSTLKGDLKVETTGRLEYVPFFFNFGPVTPGELGTLPLVAGGDIQLWFREKKERQRRR